jgi:hypothetical protein
VLSDSATPAAVCQAGATDYILQPAELLAIRVVAGNFLSAGHRSPINAEGRSIARSNRSPDLFPHFTEHAWHFGTAEAAIDQLVDVLFTNHWPLDFRTYFQRKIRPLSSVKFRDMPLFAASA